MQTDPHDPLFENVLTLLYGVNADNAASTLAAAVARIVYGAGNRARFGQISRAQMHALSTASVRARSVAAEHLPPDYDRPRLNDGMCAVAYQIMMWAESIEQTNRRDREDVADFDDRAKILQNDLENIALAARIADRALRRLIPGSIPEVKAGGRG